MTTGSSIIGYTPAWREANHGVIHAADPLTFEHPYAGWWNSVCGRYFNKNLPGKGKGTFDAPTCLRCVGARP